MQHPRTLFGVVLRAVRQTETFGHVEVDLNRGALPRTADGGLHLDVDLRAIESTVALVDVVGKIVAGARFLERVRGMIPHVVRSDRLLRTRGNLRCVLEAERGHDVVHQIKDATTSSTTCFARAEYVRVVLREAASAHETVHNTAHLMTIDRAELEVAQRQVTVRMNIVLVQHHMARAVHGLHAVLGQARMLVVPFVDVEEVHVLLVEAVVARGLPYVSIVDMRRDDLFVPALRTGRDAAIPA